MEPRKLNLTSERRDRVIAAINRFKARERSMRLWGNQLEALERMDHFLDESKDDLRKGIQASGAIISPTGSGKTRLAAKIAEAFGLRTLAMAPTNIGVDNYEKEFAKTKMKVGRYDRTAKELKGEVVVTTYQSAVALLDSDPSKLDEFDVFIYDECHKSDSRRRRELHERAPIEIGFTATSEYSEKRDIWAVFGKNIYELSIEDAIGMQIYANIRYYLFETNVDVRDAKILRNGRVDESVAQERLAIAARNYFAIRKYLEILKDVPTVFFCISNRHTEFMAQELKKAGVSATYVNGDVEAQKNKDRLKAFEDGKYKVVCARDLLTEIWDSEAVRAAVCLRQVYSRVVKTQMLGRIARVNDKKKEGTFIDFQDRYGAGQQPILVPHLFEIERAKQGEILKIGEKEADESSGDEPRKTRKGVKWAEDRLMLDSEKELIIVPKLEGFLVQRVDYKNKQLIRKILDTNPKILRNYLEGKSPDPNDHIVHPEFSGTLLTLACRVYGSTQNKLRAIEQKVKQAHEIEENRIDDEGEEVIVFEKGVRGELCQALISYAYDTDTKGKTKWEEVITVEPHWQTEFDPEATLIQKQDRESVRKLLMRLSTRERRIMRQKYGIGEDENTWEEISKKEEITRERARAIEAGGMRKIRARQYIEDQMERKRWE